MTVIRAAEVRNHFVYRAYDAEGGLLYIGCTHDIKKRWTQHCMDNPHWTSITASLRMAGPYSFEVAREKERSLIESLEPLYNTNRRRYAEFMAKKRWMRSRAEALFEGIGRGALAIDERIELMQRVEDEADEKFPGIWNSHNHPISGVPERFQPAPPRP